MKKYIIIYAILAVSTIAGFILYALFNALPERQEADLLAINDIVKSAGQNWYDIKKLNNKDFSYRASIIDNNGRLMWAADKETADNLQEAVRQGYAILDITVDGKIEGKALIETSPGDFYGQVKGQFARLAIILVILLCVISLLFLYGLHMSIIKPFKRLEAFAHKITTGRFDEPLPMDKNNIFGLFTQSFDVMRESLLEARRKQIEAERAKKELIAAISHDVKTPVTSIKLITELMLAVEPKPEVYEKLKTIETKTDQINRLINDMMHSTLEELGELKVNLTSESSEVLRSLFQAADISGCIKIGDIPKCMVDLDISRMEQVAGNIITNSYKYAGTDIDVVYAIDGQFLRIEVSDYGKGVEPNALELICTKFYRGENAIESQKDGEGLGLYIAKLLMDKMGGGLEVYNRTDGFSVRLLLRLSK